MNYYPIIDTENGIKVVNARDMHLFLEQEYNFANWIKRNIKKYGLVEGKDYRKDYVVGHARGRPRIEYILNLDKAVQVAQNLYFERGRDLHRYLARSYRDGNQDGAETVRDFLRLAESYGYTGRERLEFATEKAEDHTSRHILDLVGFE